MGNFSIHPSVMDLYINTTFCGVDQNYHYITKEVVGDIMVVASPRPSDIRPKETRIEH